MGKNNRIGEIEMIELLTVYNVLKGRIGESPNSSDLPSSPGFYYIIKALSTLKAQSY